MTNTLFSNRHGSEFRLIAKLAKRLEPYTKPGLIAAIGDDTAAVDHSQTSTPITLLTCDALVEDEHFRLDQISPFDLGWKLAATNVSDICAGGGRPDWALLSLFIPDYVTHQQLEAIYDGLAEAQRQLGFKVVGGNTCSTQGKFCLDGFLVGSAKRFIGRCGAQAGDIVAVSGNLGFSSAGLFALEHNDQSPLAKMLIKRHFCPQPRLDWVDWLSEHAHCCIDISDSLSSELQHLAHNSKCGINISHIPIAEDVSTFGNKHQVNAHEWALHGGEDYELLFTTKPHHKASLEQLGGIIIGAVNDTQQVTLHNQPLEPQGWDHLASSADSK